MRSKDELILAIATILFEALYFILDNIWDINAGWIEKLTLTNTILIFFVVILYGTYRGVNLLDNLDAFEEDLNISGEIEELKEKDRELLKKSSN